MTIRQHIADPYDKQVARVVSNEESELIPPKGLAVYTEPRRTWTGRTEFFTHPVYGAEMNINGAVAGAGGEVVHDGGDTLAWTGLNTQGVGFNFADPTNPQAGAASISFTGVNNNRCEITKPLGATIDAGNFTSLTMWIYLTSWTTPSIRLRAEDLAQNTLGTIQLEDYVNPLLLLQWQQISIPVGVGGFNMVPGDLISYLEFRVRGAIPVFDMDGIEFSVTGVGALGPQVYEVVPSRGTTSQMRHIQMFMADNIPSTLVDASMPNLAYNKLLAVPTLPIGLRMSILKDNKVFSTKFFKDLGDFMNLPGATIQSGSDGINTWLSLHWDLEPVFLFGDVDRVQITVSDDMSGLLQFRVSSEILTDTVE